jgi:hypothetical protein
LFSSHEAKTFFVDKAVAQAEAEGQPLSANERWMLRFSESDPDFVVDPARVEHLRREISDNDYEAKVAGLLERCYRRDIGADPRARATYAAAADTLRQGDHYLSIMIERALGPDAEAAGTSPWRLLAKSALFVVLVLPGSLAILMAIGLVATAFADGADFSGSTLGVILGSLLLAGMGYYLIQLWLRERRRRQIAV